MRYGQQFRFAAVAQTVDQRQRAGVIAVSANVRIKNQFDRFLFQVSSLQSDAVLAISISYCKSIGNTCGKATEAGCIKKPCIGSDTWLLS